MFPLHTEFTVFFMRTIGYTKRAFNALQNLSNSDLLGTTSQQIAALGPIVAVDHAVFGQGLKDLGEEFQWDVVFLRDLLRVYDSARSYVTELHRGNVLEGHQGVIRFFRNP